MSESRKKERHFKSSCDSWRPYFSVKPLRETEMIPASESWQDSSESKKKYTLIWHKEILFSTLKQIICVTLHIWSKTHCSGIQQNSLQQFRLLFLCSFSQHGQTDRPKRRRNNSPIWLQALCLSEVATAWSLLK